MMTRSGLAPPSAALAGAMLMPMPVDSPFAQCASAKGTHVQVPAGAVIAVPRVTPPPMPSPPVPPPPAPLLLDDEVEPDDDVEVDVLLDEVLDEDVEVAPELLLELVPLELGPLLLEQAAKATTPPTPRINLRIADL
jgi:hypothetical protein